MKRIIIVGCAIVIAIIGGYIWISHYHLKSSTESERKLASKIEVSLFVPTPDLGLKKKTLFLDRPLSHLELAEFLVRTLEEEAVIPQDTKILHFSIDRDGIIYLDLSREILDISDSLSEVLMVYGLVNTFLENYKGCKGVQILVEGEAIRTLSGILYTYHPLTFNSDLVEGLDDKS